MRITQAPLLILALTLLISSCGTTPPSKFYLLNAGSNAQQSNAATLNIGLGPIKFPAYLDRSKIMVRTGANSYKAAEYHRWAEPLETNFTRVLSQELNNTLPNAVITTYPWRNGKEIKIQVLLEVLSFDSDDNNQTRLHVRWELLDGDKKTIAPSQQHEYIKTARNSDYEERVAAMSECVTALGQALGQEVARLTNQ
jgi:hypothetical protein